MTLLPSTLPDAVRRAVEELGPQSEDVAAVAEQTDNAWVVRYLDDAEVLLTWREAPGRLEALTQVHRCEPPVHRDVIEALLAFNLLSAQTGGARMALDLQDHTLYLVRDLHGDFCQLDALRDALRTLVGTADHWREALIVHPSTPATPDLSPSHPALQP